MLPKQFADSFDGWRPARRVIAVANVAGRMERNLAYNAWFRHNLVVETGVAPAVARDRRFVCRGHRPKLSAGI